MNAKEDWSEAILNAAFGGGREETEEGEGKMEEEERGEEGRAVV